MSTSGGALQSGRGFQPAHTDPSGEVGIVAMLSLKMAASGGESLIASAHTVHNMMLTGAPICSKTSYKGFVLRRPDSDAKRMGRSAMIGNVPSFCYENAWLNCDFQHGYLRRAAECGDTTINPKQESQRPAPPALRVRSHGLSFAPFRFRGRA